MKAVKAAEITGIAVYSTAVVILVVISAIWGGTAQSGSGMTIPDTGLMVPVAVFILFSIGQLFLVIFNKPVLATVLCVVKFAVHQLLFFNICGYALSEEYMHANSTGTFYDNMTYSILVILTMVITASAFVYDLAMGIVLAVRRCRKS